MLGHFRHGWWKLRAGCGSEKGKERLKKMDLWQDPSVEEQMRDYNHHSKKPMPPMKHVKEIKKVLLQIRKINMKLKGYEKGFISEEGIKVSEMNDVADDR